MQESLIGVSSTAAGIVDKCVDIFSAFMRAARKGATGLKRIGNLCVSKY